MTRTDVTGRSARESATSVSTPRRSARTSASPSTSASTSASTPSASAPGSPSPHGSGGRHEIKETDTRQTVGRLLRSTWIASKLCWAGFRDACSFHKTSLFFKRSRTILVKTGHCFLLNGCMFLGSKFLLDGIILATVRWFSHVHLHGTPAPTASSRDDSSILHTNGVVPGNTITESFPQLLLCLSNVFWLYPAYIVSFVINCLWYNEIATNAFNVVQEASNGGRNVSRTHAKLEPQKGGTIVGASLSATPNVRGKSSSSSGLESVFQAISEEIYRILMFAVFFVQVSAVRFLPYVGPILNFVLLSWLYAYYCFDYKWALLGWTLDRRLWFFETNWAFFLGFGSPCAIMSSFFSSLVGSGVMAFLFPWFVLLATASDPESAVVAAVGSQRVAAASVVRIPIFRIANAQTLAVLRFLQSRRRWGKPS